MAVRPGGASDTAARIERVIASIEPIFRDAFREAVRVLQDSRTLEALATLLERGQFEEALAGLDDAAARLGGAAGQGLQRAADDAARFLSNSLTVRIAFDRQNVLAIQAIESNSLRLIREFSNGQRLATREALTRGISAGLNPIDQARLFRDSIGLTQRQVAAVDNFRRLLSGRGDGAPSREVLERALRDGRFDRTLVRAMREGRPLTQDQVDRMVQRYRERYILYRSNVIARTEALRSAHEGTEMVYQQAISAGELSPQQLQRTWITARDERVRDTHVSLDGVIQPYGVAWVTNDGNSLRFPGDPFAPPQETIQCRCVITTRLLDEEQVAEGEF